MKLDGRFECENALEKEKVKHVGRGLGRIADAEQEVRLLMKGK